MVEPSDIKIRLLLKAGDGLLRKFYFFRRTGNDFYWGSSIESGHHIIPFDKSNLITFEIPECFDDLEKSSSKYSFHESGVVHHKIYKNQGTEKNDCAQWCSLNAITEPKGFFAVISKEISQYDLFTKVTPSSGNQMPIVFAVPEMGIGARMYFEFFLSPISDISTMQPLLTILGLNFYNVSIGLNEKMYLIIRASKLPEMAKYPPNREVSIFFS